MLGEDWCASALGEDLTVHAPLYYALFWTFLAANLETHVAQAELWASCLLIDTGSDYLWGKFQTSCCHVYMSHKLTAAKWFTVALFGNIKQLQHKYCQSALPVGSQQFSPNQLGLRWWWFHCRPGRSFTSHARCYATVGCSTASCIILPLPFCCEVL